MSQKPQKQRELPGIPEADLAAMDRRTIQKALQAYASSLARSAARHEPGTPLRTAYDAERASLDRMINRFNQETSS